LLPPAPRAEHQQRTADLADRGPQVGGERLELRLGHGLAIRSHRPGEHGLIIAIARNHHMQRLYLLRLVLFVAEAQQRLPYRRRHAARGVRRQIGLHHCRRKGIGVQDHHLGEQIRVRGRQ